MIDKVCDIIVDVVFLFDFFGSIIGCDWKLLLDFVKSLVEVFNVFLSGFYVVLILYVLYVVVNFWFNMLIGDKFNFLEINKIVDKIGYYKGYIYMDRVLEFVDKEIFSERGGMR